MIIRNGNYTRLDGHDCALYEAVKIQTLFS